MSILSEKIEGKIITVEVKSSNLTKAVYDTENKELSINFKNGSIYMYNNVPWEIFTRFRMSESQGKFFSSEIKNNYTYKKINDGKIIG